MADYNMEVDPPFPSKGCTLKRSSSAPVINILPTSSSNTREDITTGLFYDNQPRTRRFSASFGSGAFTPTTTTAFQMRFPSRIIQIKQEEGMDVANREAAHEREVQSTIQIYQSWEDLTLTETISGESSKKPRNFAEPLHIFPPAYPLSSSPSPTRVGKQCFSPSMQQPVRNTSFCTSPVPSPTRKRSLSPIALRPSQLPVKRKCETEIERMDSYMSPPKRFLCSVQSGERLVVPHPLTHSKSALDSSLSSSSLEESSSPDQAVPIAAIGTPDSLSSSIDSPCSLFKQVDQDTAMQDCSMPSQAMLSISQETSL